MNKKKIYFLICLLVIAVIIWTAIFKHQPNDFLEVNFFDVGQGDSIFIETINKKQILIDAGPDLSVLEKLSREMSFFDRYIDMVILTHPDDDHITGLIEVLKQFEIGCILASRVGKENLIYKEWKKLIEQKNIPLYFAKAGQIISLDKEIYLKILWPRTDYSSKDINDVSVVVQLVYSKVEFLLTGDIGKQVENILVNNLPINELQSDVLKVAHHGSKNSSSYKFIQAVSPKISVISVGKDNYYGHPHQDVLERLKDILIFRTDIDRDIKLLTDGNFVMK